MAEPLDGTIDPHGIEGLEAVRQMNDGPAQELELSPDANPQAVMHRVLERHPMRSIELRRLSLDEVFVQLVQRDEGADAAEQARESLSHV